MKHSSQVDGVSRETQERLEIFAALLLQWNARINLIGRDTGDAVWERHIADSLQLMPLLPPIERAIDIGSGAGFPGLVLAIATGIPFDLIESDRRKSVFLQEAARRTQAPVTVWNARIETHPCPPAQLITARALAPLPRLLDYAAPLLAPDGVCLFLKGKSVDQELTNARAEWNMQIERFPSRSSPDSAILRLREVTRV